MTHWHFSSSAHIAIFIWLGGHGRRSCQCVVKPLNWMTGSNEKETLVFFISTFKSIYIQNKGPKKSDNLALQANSIGNGEWWWAHGVTIVTLSHLRCQIFSIQYTQRLSTMSTALKANSNKFQIPCASLAVWQPLRFALWHPICQMKNAGWKVAATFIRRSAQFNSILLPLTKKTYESL